MRLSEKIMDLRKKSGWSQEELAERLGISRQSVSKWETGESVPDIDKIIRMSELWNVSTDYLLKEEVVPEEEAPEPEYAEDRSGDTYREAAQSIEWNVDEEQRKTQRRRQVSREEAEDFLALSREAAPRIATGVLLCILSPVCLLLLSVLSQESALFGNMALVPETVAGGIGLTVLLLLVAIAVAVFITTGMRMSQYEYMEKEFLEIPKDVIGVVAAEKENFEVTFRYSITIGVVLCIVGCDCPGGSLSFYAGGAVCGYWSVCAAGVCCGRCFFYHTCRYDQCFL